MLYRLACGLLFASLPVLLLALPMQVYADTVEPDSYWIQQAPDWSPAVLSRQYSQSQAVSQTGVSLKGGHHWHVIDVSFTETTRQVIDFRNSSVIANFEHWVFDRASGDLISRFQGGIESEQDNPYFLRHGRDQLFEPGDYQIITKMDSPFYVAQPQPAVFEQQVYQQSIKVGNALTLICQGIFLALGIYYFVLGTSRSRAADLLYALFITGNFFFTGASLLVFSDLLSIHQFYLTSFPILISNTAYIAFVMVLLNIKPHTSQWLYRIGSGLIILFVLGFVFALIRPSLSMEIDRIGVGLFAIYGFTAGLTRVLQGNKTARYYLIANAAFAIPALISIGASSLPVADTLFLEHLGMFAVSMEVILLSLVISHQVGLVYKEKEAGLLATQEALQAANDALNTKERFLANVSHELRTPLNAIQGSVELMGQQQMPAETSRHLEAIHASSNFLVFLINDILDLAKMNADQLELVEEYFDLDEALDELCTIYKDAFDRQQIRFLVDIDTQVPRRVIGDANRLKQILANLLSNAFKFTVKGSIELSVSQPDSNCLTFHVTDTGIGIAQDKIESVFSAFTQADATISRKYGGTGLGLQIASKLVALMGGKLTVFSQPDLGSDFQFTLPMRGEREDIVTLPVRVGLVCSDADLSNLITNSLRRLGIEIEYTLTQLDALSEPLPDDAEHWILVASQPDADLSNRFSGHPRVHWLVNRVPTDLPLWTPPVNLELLPCTQVTFRRLLGQAATAPAPAKYPLMLRRLYIVAIDDNPVNLKVLLGMLTRLGVSASGFESAEEGLNHVLYRQPDLVLMDMQMPVMDGLETTRALRQRQFKQPVIAFTANTSQRDIDNCLEAGMNDVLLKPIKLTQLESMILKWTEQSSLNDRGGR
ncbi:ATP-binding protein [Saccharospirillum impatiens]|uniref:ATP-binding protein n=1 Tax=Saccharospirillum impatiens TaxID=169438 RepID=UPI000416D727|nr:ATP-binding protein [Saccharospirillum impatiens]